jgi:hypothetical protein
VFRSKHSVLFYLAGWLILSGGRPVLADYSRGGPFTAPNYGARAWGMAGATVASVGGEECVAWNPAMLSCLKEKRLGAGFVNLVPGATAYYSHLAFGMALHRRDADDSEPVIPTHAFGCLFGNLKLDLAGGGSYTENTLRLAYAWTPDDFLSFGVAANLLILTSDYADFGGSGSTVDAGLRLSLTESLTFAFVARNAASRLNYSDGADYTLTRSYTIGLAAETIPHLLAEADAVIAQGTVSRYMVGAESRLFSDVLALRGGLSMLQLGETRTIPHLGLGFKIRRFWVNYNANFDSDKAFEDTHRFSLSAIL